MNRHSSFVAAVLGGIIALGGVLLFLSQQQMGEKVESIDFSPGQFRFVFGSGEENAGKLLINGYRDGYALLSSGPVKISSKEHSILRLDLNTGENSLQPEQVPVFFFRTKDDPENLFRLSLDGSQIVDLGAFADWSGEIVEVGLLFEDVGGQAPELGLVSLQGDELAAKVELTLKAWFQFEPWSQKTVNFLHGGAVQQLVPLPLVVLVWAFATLLIFWLLGDRRLGSLASYGIAILLIAWMVLDLRWTANGARQMAHSIASQWALSDHERMSSGPDGALYQFISQFKDKALNEKVNRILIVGKVSEFKYYMFRAKYHFLPDSAHVTERLTEEIKPHELDYILFIDDFAAKQASSVEIWQQLPIDDTWRDLLQLVDSGEMQMLFSVIKANKAP